jgi:hypothetical protein
MILEGEQMDKLAHTWDHHWYNSPKEQWENGFKSISMKEETDTENERCSCLDCFILCFRLCFEYQWWRAEQ